MKKSVLFLTLIFLVSSCSIGYAQENKEGIKYYIEISITECKLRLYRIGKNSSLELIKEYPAGTAKKTIKLFPTGKGFITKKEYNPFWYPTEKTRAEFAKRGIVLSKVVPSHHPLNYMGSFKIHLSHFVPGKGTIYRIHGSRKEDEEKIGHRISGGCIRMKNKEGEELFKIISVGTEVNITL